MRYLIIGDLHGQIPNIYFEDFDAIIAPGDFCSDATRTYMFKAIRENLKNPNKKVKWYEIVGKREAKRMIQESLSDGRAILEKLNSFGVPVYIVPGNWDWVRRDSEWDYLNKDYYKELIKGLPNIKDVHLKIRKSEEYQFIGYGISSGPELPQYKEDLETLSSEELERMKKEYKKTKRKLEKLFEKADKPVIFLSHNVPFNTKLDKILNKDSPKYGKHYGSIIVRELIEEYQPLVSIGGHMHENFGKCKIGKTVCINAGFGLYVNTLLELEGEKIKKIKFVKKDH